MKVLTCRAMLLLATALARDLKYGVVFGQALTLGGGCSAPTLCFGTLALAVGAACRLSLHAIGVTERRFSH
jgi:hypothetical protein